MKRIKLLSILMLVVVLIVACQGNQAAPAATPMPAPTEEPAEEEPSSDESVEAMADAEGDLTANQWEWVSFTSPTEMFDVDVPMHYLLTFNDDGTLNIKADCNMAMGNYTEDAGSLTIEVGPMTRALCPEESRSEQFVDLLGGAASTFIENGFLYIDLMADGGTMMFGPAEEAVLYEIGPDAMAGVLTSNQWQWVSFTSPVEQFDVAEPMSYLLTFGEDGSLTIKADCNNAAGDYSEDAGSLTIEVGPTQLALCPGESRSEQFVNLLGGAARYFFDNGFLYIDLMADGGTMAFAPAEQAVLDGDGRGTVEDAVMDRPWEWVALAGPEERIDVDSPENYVLTFNGDGTVTIEADCNSAGGSYFFEGSSLVIELGAVTAVECGEESRSEQFLELLSRAALAFLEGGNLYIDTLEDRGTLELIPAPGADEAGLDAFDPDATPIFGILAGGGNDGVWLDPTVVSINSGVVGGGRSIDASQLGIGCAGRIATQPDVTFHWLQDDDVDTLRIFFVSGGDPTMVVVTPKGDTLCSDDVNPLVLDPYIEIPDPLEGRYAVYVGSFENDATEPGFLVFTGHDLNPATFDIAQIVPREVDPAALGEPIAIDALEMTGTPVGISPDDTPFQEEMVGGGDLGAFNIELDNDLCTGFIDAAPTFSFEWSGEVEKLMIFFGGDIDSTLVVHTPIDTFACDDDVHGADNLNPALDLTPIPGVYHVWVGSFAPDTPVNGTLTIAGDPELRPEPLTADMIDEG